ncbi:MAG: phosphoesterase PA-phosphatase [Actinobacteria bacterium]|nr:MAG: phosphoesterase PA-phosphatase [Actinomycetota bacterium]
MLEDPLTADTPRTVAGGRLQSHPLLLDHPVATRIALGLWAFSALLFLAIAFPALREAVQVVDDAVHRWVVSVEWGPAVVAAQVLDFIGTAWVVWPVMAVVAGWLAWSRRWEAFSSWVVTMAVSQLMIGPIKDLYMRARPSMSLAETSSWSFPSGHSVAGAAIAIAAVIVLVPAGPRRRNLEMLAAAFAIIMALSRVYLRAHWLSDVAAGAALGAAIAIGVAALMHRIDDRRRGRAHHTHAS